MIWSRLHGWQRSERGFATGGSPDQSIAMDPEGGGSVDRPPHPALHLRGVGGWGAHPPPPWGGGVPWGVAKGKTQSATVVCLRANRSLKLVVDGVAKHCQPVCLPAGPVYPDSKTVIVAAPAVHPGAP